MNHMYQEKLKEYEKNSAQAKKRYYGIWWGVFCLTWGALLFSILFWALEISEKWLPAMRWTLVAFSLVTTILTLLQLWKGFRSQWLVYRAGVQLLKDFAIRYNARLSPYLGEKTEEIAPIAQNELRNIVDYIDTLLREQSWRQLWQLFKSDPEELKGNLEDATKDLSILNADFYCRGRLRNQQKWFLTKAKKYGKQFILFQFIIVFAMLLSTILTGWKGYNLAVTTATSTIVLAMIALRDFLNCWTLCLRYAATAKRLAELERSYHEAVNNLHFDPSQSLNHLINAVEDVLRAEFQYWYAGFGGPFNFADLKIFAAYRIQPKRVVHYQPKPIDTSNIEIPDHLKVIVERLAKHTHDVWAQGRMDEGWTYAPQRDDLLKKHPDLLPYDQLSESEKGYDKRSVEGVLKVVMALGYKIERTPESTSNV